MRIPAFFPVLMARLKWCPRKKQERKCSKTSDGRKGPSLKAGPTKFIIQGPEGPCSLREYEPRQHVSSIEVGNAGGGLIQDFEQGATAGAFSVLLARLKWCPFAMHP